MNVLGQTSCSSRLRLVRFFVTKKLSEKSNGKYLDQWRFLASNYSCQFCFSTCTGLGEFMTDFTLINKVLLLQTSGSFSNELKCRTRLHLVGFL